MSVLDDIMEYLEKLATELEDEDVNSVNYWIAHAGLEEDDFLEWSAIMAAGLVEVLARDGELSPLNCTFTGLAAGFNMGYVVAKREELLTRE